MTQPPQGGWLEGEPTLHTVECSPVPTIFRAQDQKLRRECSRRSFVWLIYSIKVILKSDLPVSLCCDIQPAVDS
jgi:hypothetical protein